MQRSKILKKKPPQKRGGYDRELLNVSRVELTNFFTIDQYGIAAAGE